MPKGIYQRSDPEKKFWEYVCKVSGPVHPVHGKCWTWKRHKDKDGYGGFNAIGKRYRAHVYSWELHNGPKDTTVWVLHKCDNPSCVRPDHLFTGTAKDNAVDRDVKGRAGDLRGIKNGMYGKTFNHTEKAKDKIRSSKLGKRRGPLTPSWKDSMSASLREFHDKDPTARGVLTKEQVRIIREEYRPGVKRTGAVRLAKRFGVSKCAVRCAALGITYRSV